MATMEKATVIFGEQKQITPLKFNTQHLNEIELLIQSAIGFDFKIRRAEVSKAVEAAREDPLLKPGYVKVGVVSGNLVMRFKEKATSGRHIVDLLLVRDFNSKAAAHALANPQPAQQPAQQGEAINWGKLSVGNMSAEA